MISDTITGQYTLCTEKNSIVAKTASTIRSQNCDCLYMDIPVTILRQGTDYSGVPGRSVSPDRGPGGRPFRQAG